MCYCITISQNDRLIDDCSHSNHLLTSFKHQIADPNLLIIGLLGKWSIQFFI